MKVQIGGIMATDSKKVSIIIPAYNAAEYIGFTIESVLKQTHENWEAIIIDDCSKDATAAVVERYAERDGRIRFYRNEQNMGVARTRNRGFDLFRGQYVALLDSDDYWRPQMLEKLLGRAEETKADIVYCSYELVDEEGRKVCNDFLVPPETTFEESIVRNVISCSTVLVTAELAKNNRFPTDIYHEDIALWFRILREGGTARGVTEVLASYRQRSGSRSSDKLKSAARRWPIYRKYLGMSLLQSINAMIRYGYYGLIKYKRVANTEKG